MILPDASLSSSLPYITDFTFFLSLSQTLLPSLLLDPWTFGPICIDQGPINATHSKFYLDLKAGKKNLHLNSCCHLKPSQQKKGCCCLLRFASSYMTSANHRVNVLPLCLLFPHVLSHWASQ